jgi:hypothetical protein
MGMRANDAPLSGALRTIVPVFGLSGFAALAVSYVSGVYSRQSARRGVRVQLARTGVLTLFFLAAIAVLTLILSAAAFAPLEALFAPLLDKVRAWYLWLLSLLVARPVLPPPPLKVTPTPVKKNPTPLPRIDVYPRQ